MLQEAIRRYEEIWLPSFSKAGCDAVPPLDVEWVWHCHMLSPEKYQEDVRRLVGKVPDHVLRKRTGQSWQEAKALGRRLWPPREAYEQPLEQAPMERTLQVHRVSKMSYDLIKAAKRQMAFVYQVSLPHYSCLELLNSMLKDRIMNRIDK